MDIFIYCCIPIGIAIVFVIITIILKESPKPLTPEEEKRKYEIMETEIDFIEEKYCDKCGTPFIFVVLPTNQYDSKTGKRLFEIWSRCTKCFDTKKVFFKYNLL